MKCAVCLDVSKQTKLSTLTDANFAFKIIGMKLRYTSYHLTVAMTSETLMVTTTVGCDGDWFSRPSLQETGVVPFDS